MTIKCTVNISCLGRVNTVHCWQSTLINKIRICDRKYPSKLAILSLIFKMDKRQLEFYGCTQHWQRETQLEINKTTQRHTETQVHRHTGTQTHRHTGTQTHWHTGTLTHWHTGTQDTQVHRTHRYTGHTGFTRVHLDTQGSPGHTGYTKHNRTPQGTPLWSHTCVHNKGFHPDTHRRVSTRNTPGYHKVLHENTNGYTLRTPSSLTYEYTPHQTNTRVFKKQHTGVVFNQRKHRVWYNTRGVDSTINTQGGCFQTGVPLSSLASVLFILLFNFLNASYT